MLQWNLESERRKRKLDYSASDTIPNRREISKTQIFKGSHITKQKQESEWERATEGFSGFTAHDKSKTVKRKSLTSRQPQKYRICMSCDSESDVEVDNAIKWSSSEDELSPVSDIEPNADVISLKSKEGVKKRISTSTKSKEWYDKIDFEDSDSEIDSCIEKPFPVKKTDSLESEDLIEDADSRSSFTFNGSNDTKLCKESNSEETINEIENSSSLEVSKEFTSPSQRLKVKASDWVKSLNLKTPTKQSQSPQAILKDDSAKKKKKYFRNGLADQLYKLQIREKSAVRMWNHQSSLEQKASSKSVLMKVLDYELLYSLQLARCTELGNSQDGNKQPECYVLFSSEMAEDMNISSGTIVRIFPPWQKLKLQSSNKTVLLCTYYIRVEGNGEIIEQNPKVITSSVQWKCPCVTGLVKEYKSCPAFQFPFIPGVTLSQDQRNVSSRSNSEQSQTDHEHSLYVIQATQSTENTHITTDSILDSIEKSSVQTGVTFRALVHRVLCKTDQQQVKRYSLLVEDGHGIMCEVQMPDDTEKMFGYVIYHGEGKSYTFTGLTVLARTTRDRCPKYYPQLFVIT